MKKHFKGLIISAAVIIVLLAGTAIMLNYEPEQNNDIQEIQTDMQTVYSNESADKIKVLSETGELEFIKNGDKWTISGIQDEDVNSMQLDMFISEALTYETETVVQDDMAEYGLDTPSLTIEITTGDTTDIVKVGNKSAVENKYFASVNDIIFTMSQTQYNTLNLSKDDFTSFRRVEIMPDDITDITIERGGEKIHLYIPEITRMEGTVWYMTEPYEVMASDNFIDSSILEQIGSITLTNMSDDFGSERAKLTVAEGDKVYEFKISEPIDNFVNVEYNGKIYRESSALFEFIDAPLYSYVSKLVAYKHIFDIDKVMLEYDGITHTIVKKDSEGNSFESDGKEADAELSRKIYQAIIGITANAFYNNENLGDTLLKITYVNADGSGEEVIEFKAVNEYTAAAVKNGTALFTVGIPDIDHVKNSVNEYFEMIQ